MFGIRINLMTVDIGALLMKLCWCKVTLHVKHSKNIITSYDKPLN